MSTTIWLIITPAGLALLLGIGFVVEFIASLKGPGRGPGNRTPGACDCSGCRRKYAGVQRPGRGKTNG